MSRRRKSNQQQRVLSSTCKTGNPCVSLILELEPAREAYRHVWQDVALPLRPRFFFGQQGSCALLDN